MVECEVAGVAADGAPGLFFAAGFGFGSPCAAVEVFAGGVADFFVCEVALAASAAGVACALAAVDAYHERSHGFWPSRRLRMNSAPRLRSSSLRPAGNATVGNF